MGIHTLTQAAFHCDCHLALLLLPGTLAKKVDFAFDLQCSKNVNILNQPKSCGYITVQGSVAAEMLLLSQLHCFPFDLAFCLIFFESN